MRGHFSEGRLGARVPDAVCESDAAPAAREKAKKNVSSKNVLVMRRSHFSSSRVRHACVHEAPKRMAKSGMESARDPRAERDGVRDGEVVWEFQEYMPDGREVWITMDGDLSARIEAAFAARRLSYEWTADEESTYEWLFDVMVQRHYYYEWRPDWWWNRGNCWKTWRQIPRCSEREIRRVKVLRDISTI